MDTARTGGLLLLATLLVVPAPAIAAGGKPGQQAPPGPAAASAYFVQGVTGSTWRVEVDGEVVERKAEGKDVLGPLRLAPGTHEVTALSSDGGEVAATVRARAGQSLDVVLHRPVDPTGTPLITTFVNDLAPVPEGSGRLTIAHTAAAPPADIRVDGDVLLADVASAEEASRVVPKGVYPVDVVPTATRGPAVLGPVDLEVAGSALTRVFAVGVAADQTMDAVVQVLPVAGTDATAPTRVPAGTGGQAAAAVAPAPGGDVPLGLLAVLGGLLAVVAGLSRLPRRRRSPRTAD